ncbi:uncharacterized protein LOC135203256 [Macrobrachium nipponense]|uniref:uncharacterized protein LOC135203256 n=1 Tax=Macrobrachium nipponense TaxID=159736 RepID=UPI0030C7F6F0
MNCHRVLLSEEIRNEELWKLLYADDLVISAENEEDLERRVGDWQESLERISLDPAIHNELRDRLQTKPKLYHGPCTTSHSTCTLLTPFIGSKKYVNLTAISTGSFSNECQVH